MTQLTNLVVQKSTIRLWAQNLNVLLLYNPVTTQWCILKGQMSPNVSKRTRHGPKPGSHEAEAFSMLEAEALNPAEALTLKKPAS